MSPQSMQTFAVYVLPFVGMCGITLLFGGPMWVPLVVWGVLYLLGSEVK